MSLPTTRTLFPASDDVDIAVFETKEKATQPFLITSDDKTTGVTMGQRVWFLGYPHGIGSHWANKEAPFIKSGTMSAMDALNPKAVLLYIDGFNNPGFSGGPIVYWDFGKHSYAILGVVKGFQPENAQIIVNGKNVDTDVLVNSGILVAYSIHHAIDAIEEGKKLK